MEAAISCPCNPRPCRLNGERGRQRARRSLPPGATTIGAYIAVDHTAPTPVGMAVSATATLTEVSGNSFTFEITASDECGEIGRAKHKRVAVQSERFMKKVSDKQNEK
jgi:predicted thioesterase